MLQTIQTGTHISIQGEYVRRYEDGRVMVRVGQSYYVGKPISNSATETQNTERLAASC